MCYSWRSERDLNPAKKSLKPLGPKHILISVAIFIAIFCFLGILWRGKEVGECFCGGGDRLLRDVGVDLVHGLVIGPAADFHGHLFGHTQVVCQGCEAVPQAMQADLGETVFLTYPVDLVHHGGRVEGNDIFAVRVGILQSFL